MMSMLKGNKYYMNVNFFCPHPYKLSKMNYCRHIILFVSPSVHLSVFPFLSILS